MTLGCTPTVGAATLTPGGVPTISLSQATTAGLSCGAASCSLDGQIALEHPKFGRGTMVRLTSSDGFNGGIGFITKAGKLAWQLPTSSLMWAGPTLTADGSGTVFTIYGFGGSGQFALVLHPTASGYTDLGTAAPALDTASTRGGIGTDGSLVFKDVNRDGHHEVLVYDRVMAPDGTNSGKERLTKTYRWNGTRYTT